jgi:hypothetical protein
LLRLVQFEIDSFLTENKFLGDLDREIHNCSRIDGEALVELRRLPDGRVWVLRHEPDALREPLNWRELEEWIEGHYGIPCSEFDSSWSFGVHSRRDLLAWPLGYHLVLNETGSDWDYVPASRMVHIKRNVTRNAKRGYSDFYPVEPDATRTDKLRRNMAEGAALQSAIAFIRQHVQGQTSTGITGMLGGNATGAMRPAAGSSGPVRQTVKYPPGTVLDVSAGMEYLPGPLGSDRAKDFMTVASYVLRIMGVRWSMPEYMISGDASNANMASTQEAGTPFANARNADQRVYSSAFLELVWKALKLRSDVGAFESTGFEWDEIERCVKIQCDCPSPIKPDPEKQAKALGILVEKGIISPRSACIAAGYDPDVEEVGRVKGEG